MKKYLVGILVGLLLNISFTTFAIGNKDTINLVRLYENDNVMHLSISGTEYIQAEYINEYLLKNEHSLIYINNKWSLINLKTYEILLNDIDMLTYADDNQRLVYYFISTESYDVILNSIN